MAWITTALLIAAIAAIAFGFNRGWFTTGQAKRDTKKVNNAVKALRD